MKHIFHRLSTYYHTAVIILFSATMVISNTANAGFVGPSTSDLTMTTASYVNGINADMVRCPGLPFNGWLSATVWGDQTPGAAPGNVKLRVSYLNLAGCTSTITLPAGSCYPDVVIGDDMTNPGVDYIVGVVYYKNNSEIWFDRYRVTNIYSGITLTSIGSTMLHTSAPLMVTPLTPHIDMFANAGSLIGGHPSLTEYVITYNKINGTAMTNSLEVLKGDIATAPGASFSALTAPLSTDKFDHPDVAATMTAAGQKKAFISYIDYMRGTVKIVEISYNTFKINVNIIRIYGPYTGLTFPRIEAEAVSTGTPNWMATVSKNGVFSPYRLEVETFSSAATPLTSTTVTTPNSNGFENYLPIVSTGLGGGTSGVGNFSNSQYTVGWVSDWNSGSSGLPYLSQGMSNTGNILYPCDYIVHNSSIVGTYPYYSGGVWTVYPFGVYPVGPASLMAMATTSNAGDEFFAVWFTGTTLKMRVTGNNPWPTPTSTCSTTTSPYKTGTTAITAINKSLECVVYPNPVSDKLEVTNAENAAYTITNVIGVSVQSGIIRNNKEALNVSALKPGVYTITIINKETELIKTEKIVKQ